MSKNRLIIIEGPQGIGKTTLANFLRENIASANLYSLHGQKDKTIQGKKYSEKMYWALMEYLRKMEDIPMDLIFDRTFFTEEVYARLGYKEYSFTDVYRELLKTLESLNYDIYYLSLALKDTDLFQERLARENHHAYQDFSKESSVNQQNEYQKISAELKNTSIKVIDLVVDNFAEAYAIICEKLNISRE